VVSTLTVPGKNFFHFNDRISLHFCAMLPYEHAFITIVAKKCRFLSGLNEIGLQNSIEQGHAIEMEELPQSAVRT